MKTELLKEKFICRCMDLGKGAIFCYKHKKAAKGYEWIFMDKMKK